MPRTPLIEAGLDSWIFLMEIATDGIKWKPDWTAGKTSSLILINRNCNWKLPRTPLMEAGLDSRKMLMEIATDGAKWKPDWTAGDSSPILMDRIWDLESARKTSANLNKHKQT